MIKCRFCQGMREVISGHCSGCGSPVQNAIDRTKSKKVKPRCPGCGSTQKCRQLELGRFCCDGCHCVFEPPDFDAVDTRPEQNLEKKEREQKRRRRNRR